MALHYENLEEVRSQMLQELQRDVASGKVYASPRLVPKGKEAWSGLLESAARSHSDQWLADELRAQKLIASRKREKQKPEQPWPQYLLLLPKYLRKVSLIGSTFGEFALKQLQGETGRWRYTELNTSKVREPNQQPR